MKIDDILEKHLKDNLDTSLDLEKIKVSEELKEKTLSRIMVYQNEKRDYVESEQVQEDIDKLYDRSKQSMKRQGMLPKLRVVSGLAAAAILLTVGVSIYNMMGSIGAKSENSTADFIRYESEDNRDTNEASPYKPEAESSVDNSSVQMKLEEGTTRMDMTEEELETDNYDGYEQIVTTDKGNLEGKGSLNQNAIQGENDKTIQETGNVSDTINYTDTFHDLCGVKADAVTQILFRNIILGEDILVQELNAIQNVYECMDTVRYNSANAGIKDPGKWYYVLEINSELDSYIIWVGSYIVVEQQIGDEESSISYEASSIEELVESLSSNYQAMKETINK